MLRWFCIKETLLVVIWAFRFSGRSPHVPFKPNPPVDLHGKQRSLSLHLLHSNKPSGDTDRVSVDPRCGHICIRFPSKCNLSVGSINKREKVSSPVRPKDKLESKDENPASVVLYITEGRPQIKILLWCLHVGPNLGPLAFSHSPNPERYDNCSL